MFKNRQWLRAGLVAIVVLGAIALSLPVSDPLPAGTTAANITGRLYVNDNCTSGFGQISGTILVNGLPTPFILTAK